MRALIVSGAGRYADPWHPFPETSQLLAQIVKELGFEVAVDEDVDAALAGLTSETDLLVVNAGDPWRGDQEQLPSPDTGALAEALESGMGVLAMHSAVASLRDYPEWAPAIGAVWLPTVSHHPPADQATITGTPLPTGEPVLGFQLFDERYCRLQPTGRSHVVAQHQGPAGPEPSAWTRTYGQARVAVDVLGHDARSYSAPGHRRLLRQLARWAARPES
jgi:uncharacterized protein